MSLDDLVSLSEDVVHAMVTGRSEVTTTEQVAGGADEVFVQRYADLEVIESALETVDVGSTIRIHTGLGAVDGEGATVLIAGREAEAVYVPGAELVVGLRRGTDAYETTGGVLRVTDGGLTPAVDLTPCTSVGTGDTYVLPSDLAGRSVADVLARACSSR